MFETETKINLLLLQYCRMLVGDLADERLAEQPLPGVNHPAWVLGHLAYSTDVATGLLGGAKVLPEGWASRFGGGSKLSASRSDYPSKEELLRAVEQGFERVRGQAPAATAEQLARPTNNTFLKGALPTTKELVAFLMTGHMAVHLGQLSTWRRMIGLPPLF
jgi:hypothetical protein